MYVPITIAKVKEPKVAKCRNTANKQKAIKAT